MVSKHPSNFTHFESGEPVTSVEQREVPTRRAGDLTHHTNLEIIAHKTARLASEFTEFKQEMRDAIREIKASATYTHATLHEATNKAKETAEVAKESIKDAVHEAMAEAFPDGDPRGHRAAHESYIKEAAEKAEFWATMRKELGKWGLIGFISWAAYILWQAFLLGPKK